jgi:hypothetical protein
VVNFFGEWGGGKVVLVAVGCGIEVEVSEGELLVHS